MPCPPPLQRASRLSLHTISTRLKIAIGLFVPRNYYINAVYNEMSFLLLFSSLFLSHEN